MPLLSNLMTRLRLARYGSMKSMDEYKRLTRYEADNMHKRMYAKAGKDRDLSVLQLGLLAVFFLASLLHPVCGALALDALLRVLPMRAAYYMREALRKHGEYDEQRRAGSDV